MKTSQFDGYFSLPPYFNEEQYYCSENQLGWIIFNVNVTFDLQSYLHKLVTFLCSLFCNLRQDSGRKRRGEDFQGR